MIDLTPLDVRNKRGDFKKIMRGYDPQEVDVFLEIVADRLEVLVRETMQLRDRTTTLEEQVSQQADRERAVQDALVTAQGLRADIEAQSQREAEHILREAQGEAKQLLSNAEAEVRRMLLEADEEVRNRLRGIERRVDQASNSLEELERGRLRFLKEFASLLDREREVVRVELERTPFDERAIDMDLGGRIGVAPDGVATLGARSSDVAEVETADLGSAAREADGDAGDVDGDADVAAAGNETSDPASEFEAAAEQLEAPELEAELLDAEESDSEGPDSVAFHAESAEFEAASPESERSDKIVSDADDDIVAIEPASTIEPATTDEPETADAADQGPDLVFEPGLPEAAAEPVDRTAPTLEELKAEMEATLGLGVMAVPIAPDSAPLRAEGTTASPPPLPDSAPTVEAGSELEGAPEDYSLPAAEATVRSPESPADPVSVLRTGPVDPSPETWSEPVSTLELAPDRPVEEPGPVEVNGLDAPVDVTSLGPEPTPPAGGLSALDTRGSRAAGPFEGVPDLETVLAEAGIEEVVPPPLDEPGSRSIGGERDNMLLFEPEDHERGR